MKKVLLLLLIIGAQVKTQSQTLKDSVNVLYKNYFTLFFL